MVKIYLCFIIFDKFKNYNLLYDDYNWKPKFGFGN
jgi:hypothetical protein